MTIASALSGAPLRFLDDRPYTQLSERKGRYCNRRWYAMRLAVVVALHVTIVAGARIVVTANLALDADNPHPIGQSSNGLLHVVGWWTESRPNCDCFQHQSKNTFSSTR
jgi:hypothetical protein